MILNVNILRNYKVLGKGREQAAELLASVVKIFDLPPPNYCYKETIDASSPTSQPAKKEKPVDNLNNKIFLCEAFARIPTPLYQLKLLREQKRQQKHSLKQQQKLLIGQLPNIASNSSNGMQQPLPINGSSLENTLNNSTMIQINVGEHVSVPITFPTPTQSKKGDMYNIYGLGESSIRTTARNLAALEVIYQMEQILNVPRGELTDHLRKNAEKLLQITEVHQAIPHREAIPGITWKNIPTDSSFAAFHGKLAPRHFAPATRVGNIDFIPKILQNEHALLAAKAITLASEHRLPTVDVHSNVMKEGSIQRYANVQPSGGLLEGVVGPLPGGELNIGLDSVDATVVAMIYLYNKMTHEPTQKNFKKIVKERYLAMVKEIYKEKESSYGMAKLFVSLPKHQFLDLQQLVQTIPVFTLPKSHTNMTRRKPPRRFLRHHGNSPNNGNCTVGRERQERIETFRQHQKSHPLPVDSIENDIPHDVSVTIVRGGTGSGKVRATVTF